MMAAPVGFCGRGCDFIMAIHRYMRTSLGHICHPYLASMERIDLPYEALMWAMKCVYGALDGRYIHSSSAICAHLCDAFATHLVHLCGAMVGMYEGTLPMAVVGETLGSAKNRSKSDVFGGVGAGVFGWLGTLRFGACPTPTHTSPPPQRRYDCQMISDKEVSRKPIWKHNGLRIRAYDYV